MEVFRNKEIFLLITILIYNIDGKSTSSNEPKIENTTHNCPFTKIIEDIFKISNRTSPAKWKDEKIDNPYNSTDSLLNTNRNISKSIQDELVNDIIASIKRIANLTNSESKLNEAIILNVPDKNNNTKTTTDKKVNTILSGLEDKIDVSNPETPKNNENYKIDNSKEFEKPTKPISLPEIERPSTPSKDKPNYVEVLTVEPNNTNVNKSSSILEVLKNIMPMLNSSVTKDLHSITIIERNQNKNHSFSETKNISTIIVKYCDKENSTKVNLTDTKQPEEDFKGIPLQEDYDDFRVDYFDYGDSIQDKMTNITIESRKDVLEAAEYGMMKMHELYSVLEPKLYSMGDEIVMWDLPPSGGEPDLVPDDSRPGILPESNSTQQNDIQLQPAGAQAPSPAPAPLEPTLDLEISASAPPPAPLESPLDPEILSALGEATDTGPTWGQEIHCNLTQLWQPLLKKGMVKEMKEKILKQYLIPGNCTLLQAPKLNIEISAAVIEMVRLRDKKVETAQQQLGIGITAISRAMTSLIKDDNKIETIKMLSDGCRILCDLHHSETQARIKMITPGLAKPFLNVIHDSERDETLFGSSLPEKIKASKTIEKQGLQIKKTAPLPARSNAAVQSQNTTSARHQFQGNWAGPSRYPTTRGGRGGQKRFPASTRRSTPTTAATSTKPNQGRSRAPARQ